MKKCPNCGYEKPKKQPKTDSVYFPGLPLKEMIKRQWIQDVDLQDPHAVLKELMRFCGTETIDDFKKTFGYEGDLLDVDS